MKAPTKPSVPSSLPSGVTPPSKAYRNVVLIILTLIYAFSFIDRQIIGILSPFIQDDLKLSNKQMGLLTGFLFALFYTVVGIPIAWLADRYNRVNIISASLTIWSGFTALTGLATNFTMIALARMGVGIGEAGGSPPSHSIVSDLYPKESRSKALGIYSLGIPLGLGFAYWVTGFARGSGNDDFNWQRLLIILGLAGIALAVVTRIIVREPHRGAQENMSAETPKPPFKEALTTLLTIPTWWWMCGGIAAASFTAYAMSAWQTNYLLSFEATLPEKIGFRNMMYVLAFVHVVFYGAGTFLGGIITDRLAKRNIRWYGLFPALSIAVSLPLALLAYWLPNVKLHLLMAGPLLFFLGMYLAPSFAIAQTLAPINMRAMSTALFFLILNLIALGGGPTFVGFVADAMKEGQTYATEYEGALAQSEAVRMGVWWACSGFVISIICFLMASRTLPRDWAEAEARNQSSV